MKKLLIVKAIFLLVCTVGFSQKKPFTVATDINPIKVERLHNPSEFNLYNLNVNELLKQVANAPKISDQPSPIVLNFPDVNGNFNSFYVYDNSNMETELADKNPNIRSFKAVSTTNNILSLSFSLSNIFGFHASGTNIDGSTYYIDNYTVDLKTVIVYDRSTLENPKSKFECLVTSSNEPSAFAATNDFTTYSYDNKRRNFRLAIACTTEYTNFHVQRAPNSIPKVTDTDKKNIVLAAMNVTLTRLNQIFERELNIHLNLVNNNTALIFVGTDNFSNNNAGTLISQSQSVITSVIGSANYDIGHTFSTGAGGLASLGSVCFNSAKARGVTGASSPVGDAYDVDYVAHEMGHQFGANHTFSNSCQGNIEFETAMEVGSGSTIMSYAGICSPNVQTNVNDYYHYISIKEMQTFLGGTTCAQQITVSNSAPVVQPLVSKTIPYGTPFILTANATDVNTSDVLTYGFEQVDEQTGAKPNEQPTTQPPLPTSKLGPTFRSIAPVTKNYRSFPAESTVLNGTTNTTGITDSVWERLATTSRSYKFVAIVRDNNPSGARVVYTPPVNITVASTGPFVITSPNNNPTIQEPVWFLGSTKNITWDVAGTANTPINTTNVNILISTDNGTTYSTLATNRPNTGTASVTIPTNLNNTYQGRIKIEAVNNIFYTVSKKLTLWNPNMSIKPNELENVKIYPNPVNDILNVSFTKENSLKTTYSVYDLTGRLVKREQSATRQNIEELHVSTLSSGIYILMIENDDKSSSFKFIKN